MLGWLFRRRNPERLPDRVWMSSAAKWAGIQREAESLRAGGPVVLAAFFPTTAAMAQRALPGARRLSGTLWPEQVFHLGEPAIWLFGDHAAPPEGAFGGAQGRLELIVVEHHLVPEPDAALIKLFSSWPGTVRLRFHCALDEPLLAKFGAQIGGLLERLGAHAEIAIESPLFGGAIASAQKKIAAQAKDRRPAESPAAWLAANL